MWIKITKDSVHSACLNLDEKDIVMKTILGGCLGNILLQNDRTAPRAFNNKIVLKQEPFIWFTTINVLNYTAQASAAYI